MATPAEKKDWVFRHTDGVTYVELPRERLVNPADMERVCAAVEQAIKGSEEPHVVMSFTHVKHIPSLFLGKIMGFNKRILAKGGTFALTNVNDDIGEMLRVTKVTKLVKVIAAPKGSPVAVTAAVPVPVPGAGADTSALGKLGALIKSITTPGSRRRRR